MAGNGDKCSDKWKILSKSYHLKSQSFILIIKNIKSTQFLHSNQMAASIIDMT